MRTGFYFLIKNSTTRGKDYSQLLHACQKLYDLSGKTNKKIVYKITREEVSELKNFFKKNNIKYIQIIDAGKTQVSPGTNTVIATILDQDTSFFKKYKLY